MPRTPVRVHVTRGDQKESEHIVYGVLTGPAVGTVEFGDADHQTFWRSAMKPYQILPLLEDGTADAFGLTPADIAVGCGSHGGMPMHVEQVLAMLERAGLGEDGVDFLVCGPHPPFDAEARHAVRCAGEPFSPLHNNCSGKHAAMLALARHHGWPLTGYTESAHPAQARIRHGLPPWLDGSPDDRPWARDGCSVPTPYISLRQMAEAYARLMSAAAENESAPAAVVGAMTHFPELTSSPGRIPLGIMAATGGRLLAKEGAEGVLCIGDTGGGWGLALKVIDGSVRGTGPAAVEIMAAHDLLAADELEALAAERKPALLNWQGTRVGGIEADVMLGSASVDGASGVSGT